MKRLFAITILLTVGSVVFAQENTGGVKAGLNIANATGEDAKGTKELISYHFGMYANIGISRRLSIQPEVLLNKLGYRTAELVGIAGTLQLRNEHTYLSFPVHLQCTFGILNFHAGPQIGVLLQSKVFSEFMGQSGTANSTERYKTIDVGFNFGVGATVRRFNLTARYSKGYHNIINEHRIDFKNNAVQFSLGYRLFGGR